ncbi:MAG: NACHT domain-containing NTPase [Symplocastrum torsivum CPER-KK1]|jgi:predicted NACHT family NTPase|uniref:NACHT domain-containing NTPase n=1 Tax=Symplocastrum torsivum CPER-KK1 TaxID=450513 RepID=A0A951UAE8_9CYAN|nr:NACHT domain-containing NTPase [Symplocastrum torsivum CPER-KK1]
MARRSLQASVEGIKKAKQAFLRKGWTQEYLAGEVGLETRQPIWKFFAGKPVDRGVFSEICFQLDLQPEEIALQLQIDEPTAEEKVQDLANAIDALVTRVRSERHDKIQDQCGTLHLLDIARPVGLDDLYVEVNILEEITSQRWLEISDLQGFKPEEFDRLGLGKVRQEQVPGLKAVERYAKLMVLGKPGAGKTTFLQYLAIQCNQGHFQSGSVPIFIRLKNFAEDALDEGNFSLLNYINQEFSRSGVSEQDVETLLNHGKTLILLDGLDEVPEAASDEVIKQIRKIAEKYYKNQLIITCRIAAQEYRFQGFTEVEIADFKPAQIENFAKKWFVAVARNSPESGLKKASLFLEQMALPEHQPIRELAATPVLLNLTCLVFHAKADFPVKRSDLYKQGLDLLLIRWDESRGVRRDDIYRNLSLPHKLQLLSQLAAITFEQGDYFFEESRLQQLITDYLRTSPNAQTDSVALEQNSLAVVKSIEIQHGLLVERARRIYSFSHLTFQEYFTARAIVTGTHLSLPQLAEHLTEKRWREVFLLTAQMLPNADELLQLMKQQADALVSADETLQPFLNWVAKKSLEVKTPYKPAAIRAFYLALALPPNHRLASDQTLALAIDRNLAGNFGGDLALDLALVQALGVALALTPELAYNRISALRLALDLNHLTGVEVINDSLKQLKNQLPNSDADQETIKQWWQENGQDWAAQLRSVMIDHRNIGHKWHLSEASQQLVEQYANASQLLVECLNSNCQLTPTVRQMIEETLLLSHYSFCGVNSGGSCT